MNVHVSQARDDEPPGVFVDGRFRQQRLLRIAANVRDPTAADDVGLSAAIAPVSISTTATPVRAVRVSVVTASWLKAVP
jgi:hypothetical protein